MTWARAWSSYVGRSTMTRPGKAESTKWKACSDPFVTTTRAGSTPWFATTTDGTALFVKSLGRDERERIGRVIDDRNRERPPYSFLDRWGIPQSINV